MGANLSLGAGLNRSVGKSIASARFRVEDWAAGALGLRTREDWRAWSRGAAAPDAGEPEVTLPTMLRRRISPIGQMAFRAVCALPQQPTARFIFCSRHGEFQRTLGILRSLAAAEPVSPAEFSLSVHNALAGLLSIAWSNTSGHTTISAGVDSFCSALVEASACLASQPSEPILLVYFDDRLPEPYAEIANSDEAGVALALLLNAPRGDGEDLLVELEPRDETMTTATGQAFDFLRFLLTDQKEKTLAGERIQWRWRRA
jgi:hypothetical protein